MVKNQDIYVQESTQLSLQYVQIPLCSWRRSIYVGSMCFTHTYTQKISLGKSTDTEGRLVVARGWGGGTGSDEYGSMCMSMGVSLQVGGG